MDLLKLLMFVFTFAESARAQEPECVYPTSGSLTCLKFYNNVAKNWTDARQTCQDDGGDIVVESSDIIRDAIVDQLSLYSSTLEWWIGAFKEEFDSWQWTDGSVLGTYFDWTSNAPKDPVSNPLYSCVRLSHSASFAWEDMPCHAVNAYICQHDTDDCSTLINIDNILQSADTCFSVHLSRVTWFTASESCRAIGASSLVHVKDAQTQEDLVHYLSTELNDEFIAQAINGLWIGLIRSQWLWIDSTPVESYNWYITQPATNDYCVQYNSFLDSNRIRIYEWVSSNCAVLANFICEIELTTTVQTTEDMETTQPAVTTSRHVTTDSSKATTSAPETTQPAVTASRHVTTHSSFTTSEATTSALARTSDIQMTTEEQITTKAEATTVIQVTTDTPPSTELSTPTNSLTTVETLTTGDAITTSKTTESPHLTTDFHFTTDVELSTSSPASTNPPVSTNPEITTEVHVTTAPVMTTEAPKTTEFHLTTGFQLTTEGPASTDNRHSTQYVPTIGAMTTSRPYLTTEADFPTSQDITLRHEFTTNPGMTPEIMSSGNTYLLATNVDQTTLGDLTTKSDLSTWGNTNGDTTEGNNTPQDAASSTTETPFLSAHHIMSSRAETTAFNVTATQVALTRAGIHSVASATDRTTKESITSADYGETSEASGVLTDTTIQPLESTQTEDDTSAASTSTIAIGGSKSKSVQKASSLPVYVIVIIVVAALCVIVVLIGIILCLRQKAEEDFDEDKRSTHASVGSDVTSPRFSVFNDAGSGQAFAVANTPIAKANGFAVRNGGPYYVKGKLNKVVGDQWHWEKTPAETARARNSVNSLESVLTDEDMFNSKERYDSTNGSAMVEAMRYAVKKRVDFEISADNTIAGTSNGVLLLSPSGRNLEINTRYASPTVTPIETQPVQANCELEERELRSQDIEPEQPAYAFVIPRYLRASISSEDPPPNRISTVIDDSRFKTSIVLRNDP